MHAAGCQRLGRALIAALTLGPGTVLGKYTIVQELGRGGMGVVYLAEDTTLSRTVALKVLYPSLSSDSVFIERFKQEARVVANILHPSIVRINSFETFESCHAIDMEYVEGTSLARLMASEVFTPQLAVCIARDVLDGLALCHELGVVHRDIKPSNILITEDGRAKLADFGLAIAYATHVESSIFKVTSSTFFMGTPRYAPPEAWEGGEPRPDWDLYSFGLVLYEGLSGKPIYTGTTPLAIVKQLMVNAPPPAKTVLSGISDAFADFIDRLISREADSRPANAGEAMEVLRAVPEFEGLATVDSATVRVKAPRRGAARKRRSFRFPLPRIAESVFILLLIASTMWFAYFALSKQESTTSTSQGQLAQHNLMTSQDALAAPKDDLSARVFRAEYLAAGAEGPRSREEHWMVTETGASNSHRLLGYSNRFLMYATFADNGSAITLKGDWAEYGQEHGGMVRYGSVEGNGTWTTKDSALTISLRSYDNRDHTEEPLTVVAKLDTTIGTDTQFLCELERTPLVQALLYTDLLPRSFEWANAAESILPCMFGSRCVVPIVESPELPTIDGMLDEAFWITPRYSLSAGRIGMLAGRPHSTRAELKAVVTSTHMIVALNTPDPVSGRWGVNVALMPIQPSRLLDAAWIAADKYSGEPASFRLYESGLETAWRHEGWTLETANDRMSCELAIPLSSLQPSWLPSRTSAWRINAVFVAKNPDGDEVEVAAWGFPDRTHVENGALLRFEEADVQGAQ